MPSKGIITADNANFLLFDHIFHYFSEQQIDALLLTEPQTEIDPYQMIGDKSMYFVFTAVRYIHHIHMHQPVNIGPLGLLVNNRIHDLVFDFRRKIGAGQVNQVRRILSTRSDEHTSELQSLMPLTYA